MTLILFFFTDSLTAIYYIIATGLSQCSAKVASGANHDCMSNSLSVMMYPWKHLAKISHDINKTNLFHHYQTVQYLSVSVPDIVCS